MLRSYTQLVLAGSLSILFSFGVANEKLQKPATSQPPPCSGQIRYLSDTDRAYRYLEHEQRKIYTDNPGLTDPFSREELNHPRTVNNFAELKERALKACPDPKNGETCALDPDGIDKLMAALPCISLPTRFESPLFFYGIDLYVQELNKVREKRFPTSSSARFGSLPTGTINAQAILPPGSRNPVVIVNRDIFFFTGALSKSISDAIPISTDQVVSLDYSEDGIRKRLRDHPHIVANFADAMSRIIKTGSSAGAMEVTLDDTHNLLHARLVSSMDWFIIAHEDAHVILKHVSNKSVGFRLAGVSGQSTRAPLPGNEPQKSNNKKASRRSRNQRADTSVTLQTQLRTQQQELEADALGFKLMIWGRQNEEDLIGQMIAAAAPHLVFRIMEAVDAYSREAGLGGFGDDANHPPAAERIKNLLPVFDELARESQVLRQADFRTPFEASLKVLLAESDSKIRQNLGLAPR